MTHIGDKQKLMAIKRIIYNMNNAKQIKKYKKK